MAAVLIVDDASFMRKVLTEKAKHWMGSDLAKVDEPEIIRPSEDSVNIAAVAESDNKAT